MYTFWAAGATPDALLLASKVSRTGVMVALSFSSRRVK